MLFNYDQQYPIEAILQAECAMKYMDRATIRYFYRTRNLGRLDPTLSKWSAQGRDVVGIPFRLLDKQLVAWVPEIGE